MFYKPSIQALTRYFYQLSILRRLLFPASLFLLLVVLCAFHNSGQPLLLTPTDNGKMIMVSPGRQISIQLPENSGSTGYVWNDTTPKNKLLPLQRTTYVSPAGPVLPGASGTVVFTFTAQKDGRTVLDFELRRPWETGGAPARRFEVTIRVQG